MKNEFVRTGLSLCVLWLAAGLVCAQGKNVVDAQSHTTDSASAGILPVPDYAADFWSNAYLTGDWGGSRTDLANKGVQLGVQWNQVVQGVANGGNNETTEYGANIDYTINLDLMRMGVLPGALVKFRAESRFGDSVNLDAGPILPVNTRALFPVTKTVDSDVAITVTDLNFTQFLGPHLAVTFGKLDTLDGDPNEFASGRGTSQFMNAHFIFNPALALRLPYSTLGAGVIWMPIPPGADSGITVSSIFMNTNDSSTTTGFDDFDKGTTWNTEADFKYKLGDLPGGMNVGALYSFNQDFAHLNSRFVFTPGEGLSFATKDETWALYWSGWQYLFVNDAGGKPPIHMDGAPGHEGIGLFARFGFADKETNPEKWAVSGGLGGRGLIPTRHNDTFGAGYFYDSVQELRLSGLLGLMDSAQGFEAFYNLAVTPACRITFDVQVVEPVRSAVDTATVLGVRANFNF